MDVSREEDIKSHLMSARFLPHILLYNQLECLTVWVRCHWLLLPWKPNKFSPVYHQHTRSFPLDLCLQSVGEYKDSNHVRRRRCGQIGNEKWKVRKIWHSALSAAQLYYDLLHAQTKPSKLTAFECILLSWRHSKFHQKWTNGNVEQKVGCNATKNKTTKKKTA